MESPAILWFRQDLRLTDLPSLHAACAGGRPIIPCYVLDDASPGQWAMGAASRWWLHPRLASLAGSIEGLGGKLLLLDGDTVEQLITLARDTGAGSIHCSRLVDPWAAGLEERLGKSARIGALGCGCNSAHDQPP